MRNCSAGIVPLKLKFVGMFTPRVTSSKGKFSPFTPTRGGRSSAQSRRTSSLFTPSRRSPYPSRSNTPLNRSLQTSVILEETQEHRVESFGTTLPVLITEALAVADGHTAITVQVDPSGWAWLVCGRRLFVWRYKLTQQGKASQCKELTLPPSDLAHRADLIYVIPNPYENHAASCIAVSPEGFVRYWSSIAHEGSFVEISADLKGEECASLTYVQVVGCILATTTTTLCLLTPSVGQNLISCRTLKPPQGMLAGFGRRMSSFIFGTGGLPIEATLHKVLAGDIVGESCQSFYVLSGSHLQRWTMTGDIEKLEYQMEVERMLQESLAEAIWDKDAALLPNMKTWLIDMEMARDGIVILGAGMNTDVSQEVFYVFVTVGTESSEPPQSFLSFTVSSHTEQYQEDEEALTGQHLLVPGYNSSRAYLYHSNTVLCLTVNSSSQPVSKVEFRTSGDKILGAGSCDNLPLFFTKKNGLVSVLVHQHDSIMEESIMDLQITRPESSMTGGTTQAQLEELSMSEDKASRLKAAFLHYLRRNTGQSQQLIDELFPPSMPLSSEPGSSQDRMISQLSQDLIDDYPTSDPRWAESATASDGTMSASSLILSQQLAGKQQAHEHYIAFLKKVGLLDRLRSIVVRDGPMSTCLLLCEHAEKIAATQTLRTLHSEHTKIVDMAIRRVIELRDESAAPAALTPQDLFYREVSRVQEIIEELVSMEEELLAGDITAKDLGSLVLTINAILEGMLRDACQYRKGKLAEYQCQSAQFNEPEFLPWTSSVGAKGMRSLVTRQHTVTVEQAIPDAQDREIRGVLFQQLLQLTDILLDGYSCQLASIKRHSGETEHYRDVLHRYEEDRNKFISPFLRHEQYDRAAELAERYDDFATLIQICEITNNQERMQRYMGQFEKKGFSDFVFKWYMEEGKKGKLLCQPTSNYGQLSRFLQSHENRFMSWLHDINTNSFYQAHKTLQELAVMETEFLAKKKTLLSLSKLAALAADDPPEDLGLNLQVIADEEDLVLHQEMLPQEAVENEAMDPENMRVLSPRELIELYIGDSNVHSSEYDFKKALDLLSYVDQNDPELDLEALRLHVWCKAILRDSWSDLQSESHPLESNRDTVFFKIVELAFTEGIDLRDYLPHVDVLLESEELGDLRHNAKFQYLVKAGYEHIQRACEAGGGESV